MNGWELGLAFVFLILADVWLFWHAWRGERERFEQRRRLVNRHKTYQELHYERKNRGKDRT